MDNNENSQPYIPKNIVIDSQSDQQLDLKQTVNTFIQVEYLQNQFPHLSSSDQSFIINSLPHDLQFFLQNSFLLHKSQLSIVLLSLCGNLFKENSSKLIFQNQSNYTQSLTYKQLCIVKLNLCADQQSNHELLTLKRDFYNQFNHSSLPQQLNFPEFDISQKQTKGLIIQPFLGFNFTSLMGYFASCCQISLPNVCQLFIQLIKQVKYLHERKFIHGDISPNNILLLQTNKNLSIKDFSSQNFKQTNTKSKHQQEGFNQFTNGIIRDQLQLMLSALVSDLFDQENQQAQQMSNEKSQIKMILIDLENSWIEKQPHQHQSQQPLSQEKHFPTQAINYRSPQALYKRGSYPIDIWGLGHILFTLSTGEHLFPIDSYLTQNELDLIFKDQHQFRIHVQNRFRHLRHQTNQHKQIYYKILQTLQQSLQINPNHRPTIQQIQQLWS